MSIEQEIRIEIYRALELMKADSLLLAAVSSWGDTLSDDEVLKLLKQWNEGEGRAQPSTASFSTSPEEISVEEGEALLGDLARQLKEDNPPKRGDIVIFPDGHRETIHSTSEGMAWLANQDGTMSERPIPLDDLAPIEDEPNTWNYTGDTVV
jgi:hypothetical protein